jgi:RHS repeat-associated protein
MATDRRYTGQRWEGSVGFYDYGARSYDPALGRFLQADSIVPNPANPQSLNRYAYVLNNPLKYTDPSGHDPLDPQWQDEFEKAHNRAPSAEDVAIRLFSIAFPEEWNSDAFYDENGEYRPGSLEIVFNAERPEDRTWEDMPGALGNLSGWYADGEEQLFTRDIGTLFGGLKNRIEEPNAWNAISYENNPARVWVYLNSEGLHSSMLGRDPDANVHHWGWGVAMGAEYGPGGSTINTGREVLQAVFDRDEDWQPQDTSSDVLIGNVGASLGCSFRILGIRDIHRAWSIHMMEWLP